MHVCICPGMPLGVQGHTKDFQNRYLKDTYFFNKKNLCALIIISTAEVNTVLVTSMFKDPLSRMVTLSELCTRVVSPVKPLNHVTDGVSTACPAHGSVTMSELFTVMSCG